MILGPDFMPIDMACEGRELLSLLWCGRKTPLLLGQLYIFVYSYVSRSPTSMYGSLRSDDKSLTTAHE